MVSIARLGKHSRVANGISSSCECNVWFDKSAKKHRPLTLEDLLHAVDQRYSVDIESRPCKRKLEQGSSPQERLKSSSSDYSIDVFKNAKWTIDEVTNEDASGFFGRQYVFTLLLPSKC